MQKYLTKYQELVILLPLKNWSLAILFTNLLTILVVTLAKNLLPPMVPLFYGKPYGIEQLAPRSSLVLPGIVALVVSVISIIISLVFEDDFLKKILFGGMAVITILSLITTVKIIFLVGSI